MDDLRKVALELAINARVSSEENVVATAREYYNFLSGVGHTEQLRWWAQSAINGFETLNIEDAADGAKCDLRAILSYLDEMDGCSPPKEEMIPKSEALSYIKDYVSDLPPPVPTQETPPIGQADQTPVPFEAFGRVGERVRGPIVFTPRRTAEEVWTDDNTPTRLVSREDAN